MRTRAMIPPTSEPPRPSPIVAYQGIGSGPGSASRASPPTMKPQTIRPMMKNSTGGLCGGRAALAKSLGRRGSERGRPLRRLVHADVRVEPRDLLVFVDLAFADEEARVQPAIRLRLGRQLDPREDRPAHAGRVLEDALTVD